MAKGVKEKETKSKKAYVRVRETLASAFQQKAKEKHTSVNAMANEAIEAYLASGGENIIPEGEKRIALLLPPSLYDSLAKTAKAQQVSVNEAITHAMEGYLAGKATENNMNRVICYLDRASTAEAKLESIVEAVNQAYGSMRTIMETIDTVATAKVPKTKEREQKEELYKQTQRLMDAINKMTKRVNKIDKAV